MSVETLHFAMAENHGILIQHRPSLSTKKLIDNLQRIYGEIHATATFDMTLSPDYLTAVFFTDQKSGERCYVDFLHITAFARRQSTAAENSSLEESKTSPSPKKNVAVVGVGWINENFWTTWQSKPYIRGRHSSLTASTSSHPKESGTEKGPEGFLIVFWQQAREYQRMEIKLLANGRAEELWEDEKEGGRLFLRFITEDDALFFRDIILGKFAFLSRFVSLAEKDDFTMARKVLSSPTVKVAGSPR